MDNQEQFLPAMVSRSQGAVRDEVRGGATGGRGCHSHGGDVEEGREYHQILLVQRKLRGQHGPDQQFRSSRRWLGMALMDQFKEAIRQVRVDTEEGEVELPELASYHLELLLLSSMQHLRRNMK